MVSKFTPELSKVYFINEYTLYHILEGSGGIEVDFKHYTNWDDKLIYLDKGQYIKFLAEDFVVRKIVFPSAELFNDPDVRVLFKHLVSLGYINFSECSDCQRYLTDAGFASGFANIIDVSSKQWFWQNPFEAEREEYHIIFDVKEVVDASYKHHLNNAQLADLLQSEQYTAQALVKDKLGLSLRGMLANKRLLESKKAVAFSSQPIKSIGYDFGFKDPAYFSRVFAKSTGQTPAEFRLAANHQQADSFAQDLLALLQTHHTEQRALGFYAEQLHLSVKTLSRKAREAFNTTLGQLIRQQLVRTAKQRLAEGHPVHEVALQLGFEEANHFSAFFKKYAGQSPSSYRDQKYQ